MSGSAAAPDPFGLTPDTRAYVPRAETERALAELLAGIQANEGPLVILGPAGAGKTLLLHLLAERAGPGLRSVYLPNPRLAPEEIATWVSRALGAPAGEDALPLLRAWLEHLREQEQGCLLLVDDADALSEASARWLGELRAEARGGLRLALAALDGPATRRALRAVGGVREVRLEAVMSPDETAEYVGWSLRRADVPEEARARFDASALEALHRVAQGNPRRLNLAVEALVRSGSAAVLEDEIAAQAAERPTPRSSTLGAAAFVARSAPAETPPAGASAAAKEPGDASPPRARSEAPDRARPPRLPRAGLVLGALAAALTIALLFEREPADPPPPASPAAATGQGATRAGPVAKPAGATATLRVNVNASPWARIEIDGIDVGETPLAGVPLLPGPHRFRAQLPDGRILERQVEIDAQNRHVVFE